MPTRNPRPDERWLGVEDAVWIVGPSADFADMTIVRSADGRRRRLPLELFFETFEYCPSLEGRNFVEKFPGSAARVGTITQDQGSRVEFKFSGSPMSHTFSLTRFLTRFRLLPLPVDLGVDQTTPRDIWDRLLEDDDADK